MDKIEWMNDIREWENGNKKKGRFFFLSFIFQIFRLKLFNRNEIHRNKFKTKPEP